MPWRSYSACMPRAVRLHAGEIRLEQRGHVRRLRETARHVLGHTPAHRAVRDATAVRRERRDTRRAAHFRGAVHIARCGGRRGGSPRCNGRLSLE